MCHVMSPDVSLSCLSTCSAGSSNVVSASVLKSARTRVHFRKLLMKKTCLVLIRRHGRLKSVMKLAPEWIGLALALNAILNGSRMSLAGFTYIHEGHTLSLSLIYLVLTLERLQLSLTKNRLKLHGQNLGQPQACSPQVKRLLASVKIPLKPSQGTVQHRIGLRFAKLGISLGEP